MENIFIEQEEIKDKLEDDPYFEIWKEIAEAERVAYKAQMLLKDEYKKKLKNLINTKKLWEYLDTNDSWMPEGIFSVKIENKWNSYYSRMMPHAIIADEKHKYLDLHWQRGAKQEVGANHMFVQQWTNYEDTYHGYIALPLRDKKYFLISYAC